MFKIIYIDLSNWGRIPRSIPEKSEFLLLTFHYHHRTGLKFDAVGWMDRAMGVLEAASLYGRDFEPLKVIRHLQNVRHHKWKSA